MKETINNSIRVERKFVIFIPNLWMLSNLVVTTVVAITQTFLVNRDGDCHVRMEKKNGETKYFYGRKGCDRKNGWRIILEDREISKEEYDELIKSRSHKKAKTIEKTRYIFEYREQIFNLDVLKDEVIDSRTGEMILSRQQCILMIELLTPNEAVELPRNLIIEKEITNDVTFTTKALAKHLKSAQP